MSNKLSYFDGQTKLVCKLPVIRAVGDAAVLEVGSTLFRPRGELARDVLLHEQSADGNAVFGTEATVLHIDGNGYLGVVHRGEAHEYGVVLTAVLRRSRLSANGERQGGECVAGAAEHGGAHALHHPVVCLAAGKGIVALGEGGVEGFALHTLHHVGHEVIASVGYGGTEVGYLERREVHLTLSDGDGDDGESVPRAFVM